MKLQLDQVPETGQDFTHAVAAERLDFPDEAARATAPGIILGRATHVPEGLKLTGRVEAPLMLLCARCLAEFPFTVRADFDVVYAAEVPVDEETLLEERDLSVALLDGDTVDLDDLAYEQVLLALPMAPRCSEDCQGLCPVCGARKADGCGCPEPPGDPRLAGLKRLL